ncbi:MAG: hypothetical protein J6C23_08685 [Clostridia bacterium]|nr:hypothetical protein [Clostridia bacterium]
MKKIVRILSLVIALVVACTCFTGCFVTYDKELDFKQVVAKIDSYTIVNPEASEEEIASDPSNTVETKEFKFYKYQLANFINNYYASYLNAGYDVDYLIDSIMQSVLTQQIVINTAYAYKQFGLIRWSQFEEDEVTAYKYQSLDSYLEQMKSVILEERGESQSNGSISPEKEDTDASTTYPVYEDDTITGYESYSKDQLINECVYYLLPKTATAEEKAEYKEKLSELVPYALIKLLNDYFKTSSYYADMTLDELKAEANELAISTDNLTDYEIMMAIDDYYYNVKKSRAYELSAIKIPGVYGDDAKRSLENSAMDRTLTYIKEQTDALSNLSDEEKALIDEAWKNVNEVKMTKGISYTYSAMAESYIMEYLAGKSYREQILVNLLEEYIESQIGVSVKEVEDRYASVLAYQQDAFSASADAYIAAAEAGEMILFHPQTNYYFVKHVLIPFSTDQSGYLSNYETSAAGQQYDNKEEYRAYLATQITGYEHRDGENYGEALSVDEIVADIRKTVAEVSDAEKDKVFTKLMYKYSTDTGGFSQKYGYKEQVTFGAGEKSAYMEEFAEAAKQLYENGKLYELSDVVITDYGVHILMLTRTTEKVAVAGLYDYACASDNRTVYQTIEDELYNAKLNEYFTKWQNTEIIENYEKSVTTYDGRFANIIEEMAK